MNPQVLSCDYEEDYFSNDELSCMSPKTTALSSLQSSPEAPPFSPLSLSSTPSQLSDSMSVDGETPTEEPEAGPAMQNETTADNWVGFKIVGDNIDKNVRPRHQTLEAGTRSLHYFHAFAALDRVNLSGLSEQQPSIDPYTFDLDKLLPSHE